MGLFDGKTEEEKAYERVAMALDQLRIQESDGKLHAGIFEISGLADCGAASATLNGVLGFLQEKGHEIADVKISDSGNATLGMKILVLYR